MAAVPIYVWNGTAWQETGPTIPASPIKYQASAPSSPSTGDIWIDSDADVTTGSQQFQRFRFVASGGETTISGVDANGATLAYTAGTEIVVLNGSTLVRGSDYTATNGTSITGLSPALVSGDVLEVFSFMAFNVANTYTQSQVDGLISAAPGMKLLTPTSAVNGTVGATGAVTFTTQSSVSLNGIFSSTYSNYKMILNLSSVSADTNATLRLRASGTDASGSNYNVGGIELMSTYAGPNIYRDNNVTNAVFMVLDAGNNSDYYSTSFDIYNPYNAKRTTWTFQSMGVKADGVYSSYLGGGNHTLETSYDGITFYPQSGTFSGTVRVYGYKD